MPLRYHTRMRILVVFVVGAACFAQETPIHRVDVALRGVVVADGAHRVRMEFRPGILWVGLGVTMATAALLIALASLRGSKLAE